MAYLESLPEEAHLADVFKQFPKGVVQLLEFHDLFLREQSALSVAEREVIAAYVSALNGCQFCFGAHTKIADLYGVNPSLFLELITNLETASIAEKLKPILKYIKKLTLEPSKVVQADIEDILKAGWPEEAVHTAATICALFNFMNRIVDGLGVSEKSIPAKSMQGSEHLSRTSYRDFGYKLGIGNHLDEKRH